MLCSRCKKNIAVVFMARADNGEVAKEGLCLSCAKELGIKPVEEMLSQMNIDDEQMESMMEEMNGMFSEENMAQLATGGNPFEMFSSLLSQPPQEFSEEQT
ncbi:MAG: ATP-dependent Clp protease ATP-binding subunit, partial [Ruminococcaceae bacterium]|nr:ATP-dependent Clp protease ATP-binding subunit [Oscillospiraceae bacterium]